MGKMKDYLMELQEDGIKVTVDERTTFLSITDAEDLHWSLGVKLQDAYIALKIQSEGM